MLLGNRGTTYDIHWKSWYINTFCITEFCHGDPSVTVWFPLKRLVIRSFDVSESTGKCVNCCINSGVTMKFTTRHCTAVLSLIARSMGQHVAYLGPTGPRGTPCLPHEPCYLGYFYRNHIMCTDYEDKIRLKSVRFYSYESQYVNCFLWC